jgi:hypothetical protein
MHGTRDVTDGVFSGALAGIYQVPTSIDDGDITIMQVGFEPCDINEWRNSHNVLLLDAETSAQITLVVWPPD